MSFTRRARLLSAETMSFSAWDTLPLGPPASSRRVLHEASSAFASESAAEGFELFRAPSDAKDVNMRLRFALREEGVSERASSVLPTLQGVLRRSATTVARAPFPRAVIAYAPTHSSVERGLALCEELVALVRPGRDGLRRWLDQPSDKWSSSASRGGPRHSF